MTNLGIDAGRQLGEKTLEVGRDQAFAYPLPVQWLAKCHIAGQAAAEHHDMLADQGELLAQGAELPVPHIMAVNQHSPGTCLDKARQQVGQRGFTGARCPDQRHSFTGLDGQAEVIHSGRAAVIKLDAQTLEADQAGGAISRKIAASFYLDVVDQFQPTFQRR